MVRPLHLNLTIQLYNQTIIIHQMIAYFQTFINDYIIYHAITLSVSFLIVVMIVIHHVGSQKNKEIALKYKNILDGFMNKHFRQYDGELIIQSPNIMKLYPSGRQSLYFGIFAFALVPRQQIISFLFNATFIHIKDELVIQIPIMSDYPISITMAIIRKKNIKILTKKKYPDIKQLCKQYKPILNPNQNVPDTHSILVQKVQHYKYFLHSQSQINMWKQHGKHVKMVYMSDVNKFNRYPMTVRMVINLCDDILPLVQWLITFIDRMSKARMTSGQRRQARKRRQGLNLRAIM